LKRGGHFFLSQRVWLVSHRLEKSLADDVVCQLDLLGGNQVTFPVFKSPTLKRRLIGERAEDEAAVGFQIIVLEKFLTALKR
jgi:hypothetical protein